jgi:hypothetical protein
MVAGKIRMPSKYTKILIKALRRADGVLCATPEQKEVISLFNSQCFDILDFHEEFPIRKFESRSLNLNKLIWEGQPYTISGLNSLQVQLKQLSSRDRFELSLITDLQTPRFLGKIGTIETRKRIGELPSLLQGKLNLIPWSLQSVIEETQKATLALLPLDEKNFLNLLKPENRLLIMWRLGVPCITSPNSAYQRVMSLSGNQNICNNPEDWLHQITLILEDSKIQRDIVERGQEYIMKFHGLNDTLLKWDEAFESIIK